MARYKQAVVGGKYGRWTALMQIGRIVHCLCDCGGKKEVDVYNLTSGKSLSCGCLHREVMAGLKAGVPRTEEEIAAISKTQKERWQNGYYDSAGAKERAAQLGKDHAGKPQTGRNAKGHGHHNAKGWRIRSPYGVVLEGASLMHLVRENKDLFNPEDAEFRKNEYGTEMWCQADRGLRKLFLDGKNRRGSWKGWTRA